MPTQRAGKKVVLCVHDGVRLAFVRHRHLRAHWDRYVALPDARLATAGNGQISPRISQRTSAVALVQHVFPSASTCCMRSIRLHVRDDVCADHYVDGRWIYRVKRERSSYAHWRVSRAPLADFRKTHRQPAYRYFPAKHAESHVRRWRRGPDMV